MKKIIFVMVFLLFSETASATFISERDVTKMPENPSKLLFNQEFRGGTSDLAKTNVVKVQAETQQQETISKIAIFASGFIFTGIVWRRVGKRNEQKYQNIRKG